MFPIARHRIRKPRPMPRSTEKNTQIAPLEDGLPPPGPSCRDIGSDSEDVLVPPSIGLMDLAPGAGRDVAQLAGGAVVTLVTSG